MSKLKTVGLIVAAVAFVLFLVATLIPAYVLATAKVSTGFHEIPPGADYQNPRAAR